MFGISIGYLLNWSFIASLYVFFQVSRLTESFLGKKYAFYANSGFID